MKTIKGFILFIIALCTALGILYLVFQTKKLERYTGAVDYSDKLYIVFSSDGGYLKDGNSMKGLLGFSVNYLEQSGMRAVMIDESQNSKIRSSIIGYMKKDRKYILIDINPTKLISNENTILIRLGRKNNANYEINMKYASKLKEKLSEKYKSIKVNIMGDTKSNYNQELGHTALRFEISHNISFENAKTIMSYFLEVLTQME